MYELIKAGERTYYVDAPVRVGIFKINEKDVCLIDSGNDPDAGKRILRIVNDKGWQVKAIYNTHSHADHIGGNEYIQKRTGCMVYACEPDIIFVENPVLERPFLFGGYSINEISTKFFLAKPSKAKSLTDEVLPEGLEMTRLDGHAVAMAGFRTCDDVWFLGDAISSEETIEKYHIIYQFDIEEQLKTFEKVKTLKGKLFVPSHVSARTDVQELTDLNRNKVLELIALLKDLTKEPMTFEEILKCVFDHYDMRMSHSQYVLIGSTVRSYLAYLHNKGETDILFSEHRMLWYTK